MKRKRQSNEEALPESDVDGTGDESTDEESEGSVAEEELRHRRRLSRNKRAAPKPTTKRAKISNGTGTTLAIRSANVSSKSASQKIKLQTARARQSQANQEGLYGKALI